MKLKTNHVLLLMWSLILLNSIPSFAQACCSVPDSETTSIVGRVIASTAVGTAYVQTISDAAGDSFDGRSIQESNTAPGSDSCFFVGSAVPYQSSVSGTTWPVAGADVPGRHNTWGFDWLVAGPNLVINYYRRERAARNLPMPCGFILFQTLSMLCGNTWQVYRSGNILSMSFDTNSVTDCRGEAGSFSLCQVVPF